MGHSLHPYNREHDNALYSGSLLLKSRERQSVRTTRLSAEISPQAENKTRLFGLVPCSFSVSFNLSEPSSETPHEVCVLSPHLVL